MPDVQSEEKPGADWRRLSGLQGQRFVSEEVKVRAKLAYLCKLKLSSRTTDGWFQLKCEHVTEGPLDSPNAHSFYGCNSLRTGKDKGTKWEKMKKMAGGSHIAQVISNNKIVTNCCLQRQKKKKEKRGNMMTQPFFVLLCFVFTKYLTLKKNRKKAILSSFIIYNVIWDLDNLSWKRWH